MHGFSGPRDRGMRKVGSGPFQIFVTRGFEDIAKGNLPSYNRFPPLQSSRKRIRKIDAASVL